ncbi:MAG: NAD(P)H-dependent glycerol-3-phosphate dehydrogenase [Patescibacteria group bacterium]|nr:NAD(P)H-dependent glycerol-3-phosphate dehydrogenase [Patescibacteria group bacterium]
MSKIKKVSVLGAGNMGTAVAQVLALNGNEVFLWNHEGDIEPLRQIAEFHENKKYFSGIKLSENIKPEQNLKEALKNAEAVFFCVPSDFTESVAKRAAEFVKKGTVCVDTSKGLDEKTLSLIPNVMKKHLRGCPVVSLSGPSIAGDMARGFFTAMDAASDDLKAIDKIKKIIENKNLRLKATKDVVGVEIGGAFKNVYAIVIGVCDGLGLPLNTKSAILTSALKEMAILAKKAGGKEETIFGLSGFGDLVGTGLAPLSRNRRFGECLASGMNKDEAFKKVGQTVEGVSACKVLRVLGRKHKIRMPLAEMIFAIVWNNKNAKTELEKFLEKF